MRHHINENVLLEKHYILRQGNVKGVSNTTITRSWEGGCLLHSQTTPEMLWEHLRPGSCILFGLAHRQLHYFHLSHSFRHEALTRHESCSSFSHCTNCKCLWIRATAAYRILMYSVSLLWFKGHTLELHLLNAHLTIQHRCLWVSIMHI